MNLNRKSCLCVRVREFPSKFEGVGRSVMVGFLINLLSRRKVDLPKRLLKKISPKGIVNKNPAWRHWRSPLETKDLHTENSCHSFVRSLTRKSSVREFSGKLLLSVWFGVKRVISASSSWRYFKRNQNIQESKSLLLKTKNKFQFEIENFLRCRFPKVTINVSKPLELIRRLIKLL